MFRTPAVLALLAGCGGAADEACFDNPTFFRERVWPEVIQPTCMACHTSEGAAAASSLVFANLARPDHLEVDEAVFTDLAGLSRDGTSVLLLKPIGGEGHGGGAVLAEDSPAYALLTEFVARQDSPVTCPDSAAADPDEGLVLLPPDATLRKATLLLAGRLPTDDALAQVRAGGEGALRLQLRALMDEPAFADLMVERFNDLLLTDRYLEGRDGLGLLDDDDFPTVWWFEETYDDDYDLLYQRASDAVAREPLELIRWILRERRPFTEVLTADYTLVNGYSAMSYGVADAAWPNPADPASLAFRPSTVPGWTHAGLLSSPAFVSRFPTTATNRNRHRAWKVMKTFLATDILAFSERPIDAASSSVHNPTLNDPQCTVCHATMDPIAGTFQDFDDEGRLRPMAEGWYADMRPPGFGEVALPSGQAALPWLGAQMAADPRFALAMVRNVLQLVASADLLPPAAAADRALRPALNVQDAWIDQAAEQLRAADYDLRVAVEAAILSSWFRAADDRGADPARAERVGLARLLTPEELDRKIRATLGLGWDDGDEPLLLDRYKLLYGGIDSFSIIQRLKAPNGVIGAVSLRMANEMACAAVPLDLTLPRASRRLLPLIEPEWLPVGRSGVPIPELEAAMRDNLVLLHARLLGEELTPDHPEIDASFELLVDTWRDGNAALDDGALDDSLPWQCRATEDPFTGADLPEGLRVEDDPDHIVRSWMAVVAYLLSDHRFLYE
jgi:hypothetical protein